MNPSHLTVLPGAMGLPSVRWPDGREITPQIDISEPLDPIEHIYLDAAMMLDWLGETQTATRNPHQKRRPSHPHRPHNLSRCSAALRETILNQAPKFILIDLDLDLTLKPTMHGGVSEPAQTLEFS
ncbi:MAG: hypothetical protein ACI9AF_000828 [Granulosicoccus sp.]|jgi:hypothetical protein